MKGCINCKHYVGLEIHVNKPDTPRHCRIGNTEAMNKWWEENGKKKDPSQLTEMPCFVVTDFANHANKILGKLEEMMNILKK